MNIVNWTKNGIGEIKNNSGVILKIDDALLSTHNISLPNISGMQAKKAIPFALESELLDDIDDLEFFIKKEGDNFSVIVIAKEILEQIKQTIKELKLSVIGAYPNFMFLPFSEDAISYTKNDNLVSFRDGKFSGGSIDKNLFFQTFDDNLSLVEDYSKDYNLINLISLDIKEFLNKNLKPWLGVLILLLVVFSLYFINTILENQKLKNQVVSLSQQNEIVFKQIFPEVEKIVDIPKQAEQKMRNFNKQTTLSENDLISNLMQEQNLKSLNSIKFDEKLTIK
jgi:type II secretory pathway component PulL